MTLIIIGLILFIASSCILASEYDEDLEEYIKEEMERRYDNKRY